MPKPPVVDAFNRDVASNEGYLYTRNARLSSALANRRLTKAILSSTDFRGKSVLDVGCGDGTYTMELYERGKPSRVHGVDHAEQAVKSAQGRSTSAAVTFEVCSAESLTMADGSFDIAHLRGVLHHLDRPFAALREAMRVARTVVVMEPNGYNPVLKLLERVSRYHIEHQERSFFPTMFHRWARELGGTVRSPVFIGLVPFFCPDPMARVLSAIEPTAERIPGVRSLCCGSHVFVIERG
jgi:ubiquinone/menaquinone biosynthesis C-methylase UbiE